MNGDGIADGSLQTDSMGHFTVDLTSLNLAAGSKTIAVRGGRYLNDPMTPQYGAWSSVTFTFAPVANVRPQVGSLHLVQDTGTPNDLITSDLHVAGTVTHADGSVNYLPLQFDVNGDGYADGYSYTNMAGEFVIDLSNTVVTPGAVTLRVRAGESDPILMTAYGDWSTFSFTYSPPAPVLPEVSGLGLVNDTGSPGDLITGDPRISGHVTLTDGSSSYLPVQYDLNGDGYADGSLSTDWLGNFTVDLTNSNLVAGVQTVKVRGGRYVSGQMSPQYGSWATMSFSYAVEPPALPSVSGLALVNDTGTPADLITSDPRLSGSLTLSGMSNSYLPVQYDINGDGVADGTTQTDGMGLFTVDLTNSNLTAGLQTVKVRGGRNVNGQMTPQFGAWSSLTFTYTPASQAHPEVGNLHLVVDTGVAGDLVTSDLRVAGIVTHADGPVAYLPLQYDLNGDGYAEGTAWTDSMGTFTIDLSNLNLSVGTIALRVRAGEPGVVPMSTDYGSWSAFSFTYALPAPVLPVVSGLSLVNDTGVAGDLITGDPRLTGSVTLSDGSANYLPIQYDVNGDGIVDGSAQSDWTGHFTIDPTSLNLSAGSLTIAVRAGRNVSGQMTPQYGTWSTLTFTFAPVVVAHPVVGNLHLVVDTGVANDLITSDLRVAGTVTHDDGTNAYLPLQYDLNGDGFAEGYGSTSSTGGLTIDLTNSNIAPGTVSLRVRAGESDGMMGTIFGNWSTFTFTYTLPPPAVPQVTGVALVNDTGTLGDLITADPRVAGNLTLSDGSSNYLPVQYDTNGDGIADGTTQSDWTGHFTIDPTNLNLTAGAQTITIRAGRYVSGTMSTQYGDWTAFTFTFAPIVQVHPEVGNLHLVVDTETPGDLITSDLRVAGTVTHGDGTIAYLPLQYDLNGDSYPDGSGYTNQAGEFTIDPTNSNLSPGVISLRVRAGEFDAASMTTVYGSWSTFTFTYAVPPPALPVVSGLTLANDTGTSGDLITGDPRISGQITVTGASAAYLPLQFDLNGDGVAEGTGSTDGLGHFTIDPTNVIPSAGTQTIAIRGGRYVNGSTSPQFGDWVSITFIYAPVVQVRPAVATLHLVSDTGVDGDLITSDLRFAGSVTHDDGSVANLPVQFDFNGDGFVDGTLYTNQSGGFSGDLANLSVPEGTVTLKVRAGDQDPQTMSTSYGAWSLLTFDYTAAVPNVGTLSLTNDTDTPGDSITSDPRISGELTMSAGSAAYLAVQYDVNGDGTAEGSTYTDSTGHFTVDLTNLNLPAGDHTVTVRGVSYTSSGMVAHNGPWSTGLTFSYTPSAAGTPPGGGGGGNPPPPVVTYVLVPGQSMSSFENLASVINNSPDPDGPAGPMGNIVVSFSYRSVTVEPGAGTEFSVKVDGDGTWKNGSGVSKLTFTTTGSMGIPAISGAVILDAGGSIGNIEAGSVWANAGGSVGEVKAGYIDWLGAMSAKDVTCNGDCNQMIVQHGEDLTVKGNVTSMRVGFDTVLVEGNVLFYAESKGGSSFHVKGNAARLWFSGTPDAVNIDGSCTNVTYDQCDVSKTFEIKGTLGLGRYQTQDNGPPVWVSDDTMDLAGLTVWGSIPDGSTVKANGINRIYIFHDIHGDIASTGVLKSVTAQGEITGSKITATGNIGGIDSDHALDAEISSQQGILIVNAGTTFAGSLSAVNDIGSVHATSEISASIESTGGKIDSVDTQGSITKSVKAATSLRTISADGAIDADIQAGSGSIGSITAGGSISKSITAGTIIGPIKATLGEISANISAGGSITSIWAKQDIDPTTISSGGSIGPITSDTGVIDAEIDAAVNIGDVMAVHGYIEGKLTAGANFQDIWAGGNIGATIEATFGDIDSVQAGRDGGGDITGNIAAGRTIGVIDVDGSVQGDVGLLQSFLSAFNVANLVLDMFSDNPTGNAKPALPPGLTSTKGNISGNISAGNNLSKVVADGGISGNITVVGALGSVSAVGDITGNIQSSQGNSNVYTWGSLIGDVTARGLVTVQAFKSLVGTIQSTATDVVATTWGNFQSTVKAVGLLTLSCYGNFAGSVIAVGADVQIAAFGAITGAISNVKDLAAFAYGGFQNVSYDVGGSIETFAANVISGTFKAGLKGIYAYSRWDINANYEAPVVEVETWKDYTGTIKSKTKCEIEVLGDVSATVISTGGNINVKATNVRGSYNTTASGSGSQIASDTWGNVNIKSWNDVSAQIDAERNATVFASNDIRGSVTAKNRVNVSALHNISASVTGGNYQPANADPANPVTHVVNAWGTISGNISTKSTVSVFALENFTANITVQSTRTDAHSGEAQVAVLGTMQGNITASEDVQLYAGKLKGNIEAGDDAQILVRGDMQGNVLVGTGTTVIGDDALQNVAYVNAIGDIKGNVQAPDGVTVDAFGNIQGIISGGSGPAFVAARAKVDASNPNGSPTNVRGSITADGPVTVEASGDIVTTDISGSTVIVNAGGDLSSDEVTATLGSIQLSSGGTIDTTGTLSALGSAGAVSLAAVVDINAGTVSSSGDIDVFAGGTVVIQTGNSQFGEIEVDAGGNVSNSNLSALLELDVVSYSTVQNSQLTSRTDQVKMLGATGITTVTAKGQTGVTASSVGSITAGSVFKSAAGPVSLGANGAITDVTVNSELNVSVDADGAISGTIESNQGSVAVESVHGSISAKIQAEQNASVVTLTGNISSEITAILGEADVSSAGEITGTIQALQGSVDVWAYGNISSPQIDGEVDTSVIGLGSITAATISASSGNVIVSAANDISSEISGKLSATVNSSLGSVTKKVTAVLGDASVFAEVSVLDQVTAGQDAEVFAYGNIDGEVNAGRDIVVTGVLGNLSQPLSAGRDVTTFAGGETSGTIDAGRDASVESLGSITGTVNAGRDVSLETLESLTSTVTAGHNVGALIGEELTGAIQAVNNASAYVVGGVTGDILASVGTASLTAWGLVTSSVSAGLDVWIFAGSGATGTYHAGRDLEVDAIGILSGLISAGRDATVLASDVMTAPVDAGRDASVIAFKTTQTVITAGQDAFLFAGGDTQGPVTGGRDASIVTLGNSSGSVVHAGGDALLYAVGGITTAGVTGQYGTMISWGDISGPSAVAGIDGAFAFSYGNYTGSVSSVLGDAELMTYGNAVLMGGLHAGGEAIALTVGSFTGSILGGTFAGAITLGDFTGSVTSGGDAMLIGQGNTQATVVAGQDLSAWNVGNLSGSYSAARDLGVVSFGNIPASLHAGHDIVGVAALGNLSGIITADDNIGEILSYGDILATVSALNTQNVTGGGTIGPVTAWGAIDGSFTAATSLESFHSGGALNAVLSAPSSGSQLPFDSTIFTTNPAPSVPASVTADVQAGGAAAYADVIANRNAFQTDVSTFNTTAGNQRQDAPADVIQARLDLAPDIADDLLQDQTDVAQARGAATQELNADVLTATGEQLQFTNKVNGDRTNLQSQVTSRQTQLAAVFASSVTQANQQQVETNNKVTTAGTKRTELVNKDAEARAVDQDWQSQINSQVRQAVIKGAIAAASVALGPFRVVALIAGGVQFVGHVIQAHGPYVAQADQLQLEGLQRGYYIWANATSEAIGLSKLVNAFDPVDPYADNSWSVKQLTKSAGLALIEAATTAGLGALYSRFTSPCGSWLGGKCFVGDTQVLTREIEDATTSAVVGLDKASADSLDWLTPVCILIGVSGTLVLQRKTRRRLRTMPARCSALDEVFSQPELETSTTAESISRGVIRNSIRNRYLVQIDDKHRAKLPEERVTDISERKFVSSVQTVANSRTELGVAKLQANSLLCDEMSRDSKSGDATDRWRPATWAWLLSWFVLGAGFFLQSSATSWSVPTQAKETITEPTAIQRFESRAIQEIRTGMKVVADNPELDGQEAVSSAIDPETWRNIRLRMDKPDGSELQITLLRSVNWLESRRGKVGRDIDVALSEFGVAGPATIEAIEPCPPIDPGPGRVVTGTFRHSAANVIDLDVTGETKPIGTTANHPFWSDTRQDFVQAGTLQPVEELRTAVGKIARVVNHRPRVGSHSVFNLEVDSEHVFAIASQGVIVHNSHQYDATPSVPAPAKVGETAATATGKSIHKKLADARRASGDFDLVQSAIKDKAGNPILVSKRVDLKTGTPQPGSPLQEAVPDAVSFKRKLILDDKPLDRAIAKDRQEIVRFINAYKQREGNLPDVIGITRYDPKTGLPVVTELYSPYDFLP